MDYIKNLRRRINAFLHPPPETSAVPSTGELVDCLMTSIKTIENSREKVHEWADQMNSLPGWREFLDLFDEDNRPYKRPPGGDFGGMYQ
jgi:hypothetical protein